MFYRQLNVTKQNNFLQIKRKKEHFSQENLHPCENKGYFVMLFAQFHVREKEHLSHAASPLHIA